MAKILVLFAHPALEKSRVHSRMVTHLAQVKGVTLHDLYQEYPDFNIDVEREKKFLIAHDVIILQHPFHWYSAPAIIKLWEDLVLEHGWAYGSGGTALRGKKMMNAISTGGMEQTYSKEGNNRFSIREFLAPFDQTAKLCHMDYLPPFVIHGTHRLREPELDAQARFYREVIMSIRDEKFSEDQLARARYINDLFPAQTLSV